MGDKFSKLKSNIFVYASNKQQKWKSKNNSIYNSIQEHEILKNKCNRMCIFTENYKTLLRKIKNLNKWKDITCSWKTIAKDNDSSKFIYRVNKIQ